MSGRSKINPKNPAPPPQEADKVLKELREKSEKTAEEYHRRLNALHDIFKEEPIIADETQKKFLSSIRKTTDAFEKLQQRSIFSRAISAAFRRFIPGVASINKELKLLLEMNFSILAYLESLLVSLATYDSYKARFHTRLLQYTQQVGPLAHSLQNEISRQVTVFPIERMDLVFMDLMRQMEQLRTDIEKLKIKIDSKD